MIYPTVFLSVSLQKARLARIQIAKATSGAAFVSKKKAAEAKMAAKAAGMPVDDNFKEDVFELQHHHLLRCLEKTTVRERFHQGDKLDELSISPVLHSTPNVSSFTGCPKTFSLVINKQSHFTFT